MAVKDLNLEFEEDREEKRQGDAFDLDVDLSFSVTGEHEPMEPLESQKEPSDEGKEIEEILQANVAPIAAAKARQANKQPSEKENKSATPKPAAATSATSAEILGIKERLSALERQTQDEVETRAQYLANAMVLERQINQVAHQIYAKAPQLKKEVLTIKKLLNDFARKSASSSPRKK